MSKPIIVIKFGTASITHKSGELNEEILQEIARQVSILHHEYQIVMVSSGAVGAGKSFIGNYKGTIAERKAAAAIGNPLLLAKYTQYFSKYGITVAQSLCERHHFAHRNQFLQLKETYQELWKNGIIPIANENDVVSNLELKFSDNDELATLIATGFGADTLLLCTSVGGLLDAEKNIIPYIAKVDASVLGLANDDKSSLGLGGMISKLTYTRLATSMGTKVVIFGMKPEDGILKALVNKNGTSFASQKVSLNARQKWLASGSLIAGKVQVDSGASLALENRKSLLAVGIKKVIGVFEKGEVFEIIDEKKNVIAIARARESSEIITANLKTQNFEVANADDIVIL
ncbi:MULTISPECIES: glutamate 5-kinase [unclassified Arcicella]|uniref:glutamate 5-kinase n=1 Tax=unclassified Arcicella TaxID=2644986 RepID=UPI00285B83CB|nr:MULTISPECIES: glutamate 5-kinase [unclassified Arcicella]MDR6560303.1 glutamate 5-kinase [Arcicella sp. BE51]MDR6810091.1 glutamate 5-kinase [Arcicella sp. BE140]MDR6821440.1 glutamate 5-kinase [Arcicella sp. BE139]